MVDSSAWIEYLRRTGSPTHLSLRELIETDALLHTTAPVLMEILTGARDDAHEARIREEILARCVLIPLEGLMDFELAARLHRQCRRGGATVRKMNDCLIAAVAMRADLPVLHADKDFDALAEHTALRVIP
jgi:predicted nucleic acid-binding protein